MSRASLLLCSFLVAAPAVAGPKVVGVDVRPSPDRVDVVLHADAPPTFQSWARSSPSVLMVDLLETEAELRTLTPGGPLERIEVTREDARGLELSRFALHLKEAVDYDVSAQGNDVTISLYLSRAARAAAAQEVQRADVVTAPPTTLALSTLRGVRSDVPGAGIVGGVVEGSAGRATAGMKLAQAEGAPKQMTYIGFKNTGAQSRVYARINGEAKYTVRSGGENIILLEIQNATIPLRNNRNHLDTTFFESPVKMITPSEVDDTTPLVRIAIEMKEAAPYETKLEGREIVLIFKK